MRIPISFQLGLLVLLTAVTGVAVLSIATVNHRVTDEKDPALTAILVVHHLQICRGR